MFTSTGLERVELLQKQAKEAFGSAAEAESFLNTAQPAYLGRDVTPVAMAEKSYSGYETAKSMLLNLTSLDC